MPNHVSHFDIHADDLARARRFYERVFGWIFRAWGPPDFFRIQTGPDSDPGRGLIGFECTISVDDIDAIATVGKLIQFHDTEGNVVCAMQYDPGAR